MVNTDTLFMDFSKAFDKVPHKRVLLKLSQYGILTQLLDWIKDFLEGRTQSIVIGDYSSNPCRVLSGVSQGTALGPFSLYAMLMVWQLLLIQRSDYMPMKYYFIELLTPIMTVNVYKMT